MEQNLELWTNIDVDVSCNLYAALLLYVLRSHFHTNCQPDVTSLQRSYWRCRCKWNGAQNKTWKHLFRGSTAFPVIAALFEPSQQCGGEKRFVHWVSHVCGFFFVCHLSNRQKWCRSWSTRSASSTMKSRASPSRSRNCRGVCLSVCLCALRVLRHSELCRWQGFLCSCSHRVCEPLNLYHYTTRVTWEASLKCYQNRW